MTIMIRKPPPQTTRSGVVTSPRPVAQVATKLVTVATLLRGKTYFFENEMFRVNKPRVVPGALADQLEVLYHEVTTSDGQLIERALFKIVRNTNPPPPDLTDEQERQRQRRERLQAPANTAELPVMRQRRVG